MSSHDFTLNEAKTEATTSYSSGNVSLTHSQLTKAYFANSEDDREELSATLNQTIGSGWSLSATQIWDMSYGKTVREKSTAAINWAGGPQNCLTLAINYQHDPNSDRDISAVDQINFVLSFKHLGALSQDTIAGFAGAE
jgi:LPS-assembly protein